MKRFAVYCLFLLLLMAIPAAPVMAAEQEADEISSGKLVTDSSGFPSSVSYLFDSTRGKGKKTEESAYLTLSYDGGIGSLYLIFGESYGAYEITDRDSRKTKTVGEQGYVHDFVDLVELFGAAPKSVTISFLNGPAALYELEVYTRGQVPDSVQKWSEPVDGKTDLVLFSTHSDDDQLFFAGVLPYYGVERDMQVQVVYLTNHFNSQSFRIHEALDGLWAVGIRSYPVFGPYPDFADQSTLDGAFEEFEKWGYDRQQMTGFVVEQLRRFKPLVAVGHDFDGEYGHIQHKVYARLLADAVELSNDPLSYPEIAEKYGVWDVPKTYIHLYGENQIVMDWDQPMESFDGMTPYEVARDLGFECHTSQHGDWENYFNAAKASRLVWQSPCYYGLYRTTVGPDEEKNDFFENLTSYKEQDRLAAEEAARLAAEEAARKAEEDRRQEQERLALEASRAEEERLRLELQQKEAQALARRQKQERNTFILLLCLGLAAVSSAAALLILRLRSRKLRK